MGNFVPVALVIVICVAIIVGALALGGSLLPGFESYLATAEQEAENERIASQIRLLEKETELRNAETASTQAEVDLKKLAVQELAAVGDLALKKGQAEALTDTVQTSNKIVQFFATIMPLAPPTYIVIGYLPGIGTGLGFGIIIGFWLYPRRKAPDDYDISAPEPTVKGNV